MAMPRLRRVSPLLLLLALAAACFEPPVRERLRLDFLAEGSLRLTTEVELAGPEAAGGAAVERRLAETERDLLAGTDAWTRRFVAVEPAAERYGWERRLGRLHRVSRTALLARGEGLGDFFADTDLAVRYQVDAERHLAELAIYPGSPSRASRRERRQVAAALAEFSTAVATYLAETAALYRYLDEHPERSRACLGVLYRDLLDDDVRAQLPPTTVAEKAQLDRLSEAMLAVVSVLTIEGGEERSLDEASRLVYDPFPAELTVSLPAPAQEVEGFEAAEDGTLRVLPHGLWGALSRLGGRWVSPEPAQVLVAQDAQPGSRFDFEAMAARPRRTVSANELPDAGEVREALVAELAPAGVYRALWAIDPEAEPADAWP